MNNLLKRRVQMRITYELLECDPDIYEKMMAIFRTCFPIEVERDLSRDQLIYHVVSPRFVQVGEGAESPTHWPELTPMIDDDTGRTFGWTVSWPPSVLDPDYIAWAYSGAQVIRGNIGRVAARPTDGGLPLITTTGTPNPDSDVLSQPSSHLIGINGQA